MYKNTFVLLLFTVVLTGCLEEKDKEYSLEEVVAAWKSEGEHAPLVDEVREACHKSSDKGVYSPTCRVYNLAQSRIASIEMMKNINKK